MSAITQASAQVAKTVAVSTGKVTNAKSMMVWKPHGNKYVIDIERERRVVRRAIVAPIVIHAIATPLCGTRARDRDRVCGDDTRAT